MPETEIQRNQRQLNQQELQVHIKCLLQLCEMRSLLNRNETARELGINPDEVTDLQLCQHYAKSGRATEMREVNGDDNYWLTGVRLRHNPRDLPFAERVNELWQTFLAQHPGLVPTFVPYCLREEMREPPCYRQDKIPVCMREGHPKCEFAKQAEP